MMKNALNSTTEMSSILLRGGRLRQYPFHHQTSAPFSSAQRLPLSLTPPPSELTRWMSPVPDPQSGFVARQEQNNPRTGKPPSPPLVVFVFPCYWKIQRPKRPFCLFTFQTRIIWCIDRESRRWIELRQLFGYPPLASSSDLRSF